MRLWRRSAGIHAEQSQATVGRDRSRLEADLRQHYAAVFEERWGLEAERRVQARVARAIAVRRMAEPAPERPFRIERVMGSHVAAIVCAGAAVIAFGNVAHVGPGSSPAYVPPTSAPITGKPTRAYVITTLSLLGNRHAGNLARPV